jgi:hypothetical protein
MKPSDAALKLFEKVDKKKFLPSQQEAKEIKAARREEREENRQRSIERIRKAFSRLGIALKPKAKGPNPLSMKKKAGRSQSLPAPQAAGAPQPAAAAASEVSAFLAN